MSQEKIIKALGALAQDSIFFGPQGFQLANNAKLMKKFQVGYLVNKNGQNLAGEQQGQWQKSWLNIARDTELGDPYFVDLSNDSLSVYTAFYHQEKWHQEKVSTSLSGFISCLALLKSQGKQESAHFVPDEKSINDPLTLSLLHEQLIQLSHCANFWQNFIQGYKQWLTDDE